MYLVVICDSMNDDKLTMNIDIMLNYILYELCILLLMNLVAHVFVRYVMVQIVQFHLIFVLELYLCISNIYIFLLN